MEADKNKNKSNRSKADLFEIIIASELSKNYKLLASDLGKERDQLINKISKFSDGEERVREQYERAKILIPSLVKKIDSEMIPRQGSIKLVDWVGRKWQEKGTLSDVNIIFKSGVSVGLSLKSTRKGGGTQKILDIKNSKIC